MESDEVRRLVEAMDTAIIADSQRAWDALRPLREAVVPWNELLRHADRRTVEDATAGIDAIRSRNHHYFVDRGHTGRLTWTMSEQAGQ